MRCRYEIFFNEDKKINNILILLTELLLMTRKVFV